MKSGPWVLGAPNTRYPIPNTLFFPLDDLQLVSIWQWRKWSCRQSLIPVGNGGDIIPQGQVPAFAPPPQRLDGDLHVTFKTDGVRNVPAVHPEARLRAVVTIGTDDLRKTGVGGRERHVAPIVLRAGVKIVRPAEIVLRTRPADRGEL